MLLFSEKEWISDDVPFQITSEVNLDVSALTNVFGLEVWQKSPLFESIV